MRAFMQEWHGMKKYQGKITWQNDQSFHWFIASHGGRNRKRWRMKWRALLMNPDWTTRPKEEKENAEAGNL